MYSIYIWCGIYNVSWFNFCPKSFNSKLLAFFLKHLHTRKANQNMAENKLQSRKTDWKTT